MKLIKGFSLKQTCENVANTEINTEDQIAFMNYACQSHIIRGDPELKKAKGKSLLYFQRCFKRKSRKHMARDYCQSLNIAVAAAPSLEYLN